jgi:peptidoglycan/xylan/chitin deacetylase (PgdA/CDA1 family)/glycosyltransferase involved in cell wall biosynthesis
MEETQQYPQISVVIPTRNEAQNLHYVLPRIPPIVSEVILVDGHSSDDTIAVAQQLLPSIRIIRQQVKGKGDALRVGFAESTGDIIVMIDADGSTDPNEIMGFVEALLQGNDFAKGSRFVQGGGSHDITALRALGNFGLSQLVNILFGTRYSDLCYGYNAFWKRCLDCIHLDCDGFEIETQLNIRMHNAGLKITEIPSIERPRLFGQSHLRTFRDGWRVLRMILQERMRLNRAEEQKVPVLMYHSISDHASPKFKQFVVSPKLFAEHMAYLHQHKYTPVTVTQFVAALTQSGSKLPERPVVLTFDDGFADFYTEALPVIKRYGFAATLYAATAFINGTSRWLQHEGETARPMLTWEQLREINASGIECGGHSHSHPQLDILSQAEAYNEIVQCKRHLEDHLDQEVSSFAYPFGYHTADIRRLVQEVGYTSACAVKYAMSSETTDPFALARLVVRPDTNVDALAALLGGHSSPVFATIYARARTPLWQLARRSSASMTRRLEEGLLAR